MTENPQFKLHVSVPAKLLHTQILFSAEKKGNQLTSQRDITDFSLLTVVPEQAVTEGEVVPEALVGRRILAHGRYL